MRANPSTAPLIAALAAAAFLPALANGFVYDDEQYILGNALIARLSGENLRAILAHPYFGNYHPLHLLLILAQRLIFGLNPLGWHAVSLALHAANAALLLRLLGRLGVAAPVAAAGAALFAVHPVQAESVAWVAEQKSLLSLLFTLLAFGAYLDARSSGRAASLARAALAFAAALASKVAAIGLVPALIAYEILHREGPEGAGGKGAAVRLLPFVLLGGLWCNLGILAHGEVGFIHAYPGGSLASAVLSIAPVLVAYAWNLIWPMGLSASYGLPPATELAPLAVLGAWLLTGAAALLLARAAARDRSRHLALGLAWIAGFLLPVLNLVPIGTLMNDRYLYAPLCAIGPMAAAGLAAGARRAARAAGRDAMGPFGPALFRAFLLALALAALSRAGVWRDAERLWTDAAAKSPRSAHARYNLGTFRLERGELDRAARDLRAAVEIDPAKPRPWQNLGVIHYRQGRYRLAAVEFAAATKLAPRSFDSWLGLAAAQAHAGRVAEARAALARADRLRPGSAAVHLALGTLLERAGDRAGAGKAFGQVLRARDRTEGQVRAAEERLRTLRIPIRNPERVAKGGTALASSPVIPAR
jgi:tetratricopeptide (TPR) repeat protein